MTVIDALFRAEPGRRVRTGIIGMGDFSSAIVGQARAIAALDVQVGADTQPGAARAAFRRAGWTDEQIVDCESAAAAMRAIERGQRVALADAALLIELPLEVVVEATGNAEAGAGYALAAIRSGKHVAMVNKEADCVVGPILKHNADRAGVVYTAVEGDQHGLLMGLVAWARAIGLEVVCGGKFCDSGIRFDAANATLSAGEDTLTLAEDELPAFGYAAGSAGSLAERRAVILGARSQLGEFDYEELAIAANATGLLPDIPALHHPTLRLAEVPGVLCPAEDGGVLSRAGAIDAVIELRGPRALGLGGGVFITVRCSNDTARETVLQKGDLQTNAAGTVALIHRPYHFCGVEATLSILYAGLLGIATGASEYLPRVDVLARAACALPAGHTLELSDVQVELGPARPVGGAAPLPLRLLLGQKLARELAPGESVSAESVAPPANSLLLNLREEQDRVFLR